MIGHLTQEQRERYTGLTMTPEELMAADEHLSRCTLCRDEIAAKMPVVDQIADVQAGLNSEANAPAHLGFELLLRYAENRLGDIDKEAVSSHLALCSVCSAEFEDLVRFRAEMSTYAPCNYTPAKPLSLMERLRVRQPVMRSVGIVGLSAAAAVMLFTVITHKPSGNALPGNALPGNTLPVTGQSRQTDTRPELDQYRTPSVPASSPKPKTNPKARVPHASSNAHQSAGSGRNP